MEQEIKRKHERLQNPPCSQLNTFVLTLKMEWFKICFFLLLFFSIERFYRDGNHINTTILEEEMMVFVCEIGLLQI